MGKYLITVDKAVFEEQVRLLLDHKIEPEESADKLGMSVRTLNKRIGQYLMPEKFGDLPDGFLRDKDYGIRQARVMEKPKDIDLDDIPRFR